MLNRTKINLMFSIVSFNATDKILLIIAIINNFLKLEAYFLSIIVKKNIENLILIH